MKSLNMVMWQGGVKVGYELAGWCVLRRVWKYLLQEKRGFRRVA